MLSLKGISLAALFAAFSVAATAQFGGGGLGFRA